jgi:eukaryotic-like serine/threonine-protein kinase
MTQSHATDPLRVLFERYCAIAEDTRTKWLEAQTLDSVTRVELRALIAAADRAGSLDRPVGEWFLSLEQEDDLTGDQLIGQTIGDYRLVRHIGSGGMGTVYLGERVVGDFKQQAAIKLFNRPWYSAHQADLFRRERQILASLSHPNIARLLDAGITENNISFLVMEYVEGSTIGEHCCKAALSVVERLKLVLQVCSAVASAHMQLVVHRDIKPNNVMVSAQGQAKLLDFGIAKLLDQDTQTKTGEALMTFVYAAPEQRNGGRVSTTTDVYALGVLMHELLVGKRPDLEFGSTRASQLAGNSTEKHFDSGELPAHPKQLAQILRGDLDTILQRALESEPARRYPSALALAEDIERYLSGRAVLAHPPSGWYLARKFVARHRGSVTLTALLVLGIVLSLFLALQQAARATKAAAIATAQSERAEVVRDFLLELMRGVADDLPRDQRPTPAQLAAKAQKRLASDQNMAADVRLDLLLTFSEINLSEQEFDAARETLEQAKALLTKELNDAKIRWLRLDARRLHRSGKREEAASLLRPFKNELVARASEQSGRALQTLAYIERELGQREETIYLLELAASQFLTVFGPDHYLTLEARLEVGSTYVDFSDLQKAESILKPTLERWRELKLPLDANFAEGLAGLGMALMRQSELDEARVVLEECLKVRLSIFTAPHDRIANSLSLLGQLEIIAGHYEQAVSYRKKSLAMRLLSFPEGHPQIIATRAQLANSELSARLIDDAARSLAPALASCEAEQYRLSACESLSSIQARLLLEQKRLPEAKAMAKKNIALVSTSFGADSANLAPAYMGLALVEAALGAEREALAAINTAFKYAGNTEAVLKKTQAVKVQILGAFARDQEILQETSAYLESNTSSEINPHDLARVWIVRIEALRRIKKMEDLPAARAALAKIDAPYLQANWLARREQVLQDR